MATERKLDIFRVMKEADSKNDAFFGDLSEPEQKEFQPFLVARWMSGTFSKQQIVLLNEFVNPYVFSLQHHKHLLWKLLTVCTSGKVQRYVWNKLPSKVSTKPVSTRIVAQYFEYSFRQALDATACFSGDEILDMADELGLLDDEIAKIRKEHKDAPLRADILGKKGKKSKAVKTTNDVYDFIEF